MKSNIKYITKQLFTQKQLGDYYGIFNPSYVNKNLGVVRVEKNDLAFKGKRFNNSCDFYLIKDKEILKLKQDFLPNTRVEDIRLFQYKDSLYSIHSLIRPYTKWIQCISQINLKTNTLIPIQSFLSPSFRDEKNWGAFIKDNEIYILYSISPFTIFFYKDYKLKMIYNDNFINNEFVGLSTLPIEYEDNYLVFYHKILDGVYIHYALLFDKNTFKPLYYTPEFLFKAYKEPGNNKNVLYFMNCIKYEKTIDIYYGLGDASSHVLTINREEFNKKIYKNEI